MIPYLDTDNEIDVKDHLLRGHVTQSYDLWQGQNRNKKYRVTKTHKPLPEQNQIVKNGAFDLLAEAVKINPDVSKTEFLEKYEIDSDYITDGTIIIDGNFIVDQSKKMDANQVQKDINERCPKTLRPLEIKNIKKIFNDFAYNENRQTAEPSFAWKRIGDISEVSKRGKIEKQYHVSESIIFSFVNLDEIFYIFVDAEKYKYIKKLIGFDEQQLNHRFEMNESSTGFSTLVFVINDIPAAIIAGLNKKSLPELKNIKQLIKEYI